MNVTKTEMQTPLMAFETSEVRNELKLNEPYQDANSELHQQALSSVDQLMKIDPNNIQEKNNSIAAVEAIGAELQKMAARRSDMLKQSIHTLSKTGDDGGLVATSLIDLRTTVEELDPNKVDFSMNWFRRMISMLPFVGTPIEQYFAQYQSADSVISNIVNSLEKGKDQLKRDVITLDDDQHYMYDLSAKLKKAVAFAEIVDNGLTDKVENKLISDDPKVSFIKEEIMFPLRQRIMDLQQQLAVSQQAVLTIEIIKRNNKELVRGVSRALGVTINALQVAVTLSLALANQRIVLEKINSVNKTTDNLISKTAEKLKTQGVEIHKQASSAQLSMDVLKQAFNDIQTAYQDISNFRQAALPNMASTILEMDEFAATAEETINKMESSKQVEQYYGLDIINE
ncbi:MAG: toxic anion resistance protein [Methylococcaceae bacterium]|nr:toxic anion resistance protein [Methylococcaceae bacterium]